MENKKKAILTGTGGQDGSYLVEYLLSLGYEVHGIIRRNSVPEHQESRLAHLGDKIKTYYGDVMDLSSIERVFEMVMPDEIYHLAAQSHVRISFDIPTFTSQVNAIGTLNVLEAFRRICPKARMYNAASSEMFGNSVGENGMQSLDTPFQPCSPYGISKVFAFNMAKNYRKSYNLFITNGILFNHESPRRGSNFVTTKVVKGAIDIKNGVTDKLVLGNLDSFRDWGHSVDYTKVMHMILNHDVPDDFIVSTGEAHSIRELCDYVFSKLGMDYKQYVIQDPKFLRPDELNYLKGDCSKLKNTFGWKPHYTFETLLDDMIDFHLTLSNK